MLLAAAALLLPLSLSAQVDKKDVRRGNRDYRKALVKDSLSVAANYNLAADLYRQGDAQGAMKAMQKIEQSAVASGHGADYYYNLGDMALSAKDYKTAVDAFAKSLMIRPDDLDAKENYIYARKMLQDQQQNGGGNGGQNDRNQDQNNRDQNQDDQNQNRDNQDQDGQDNKDQNKDQNDGDNQQDKGDGQNPPQDSPQNWEGQPQEQKISPQAAQQMLQAIQAKEKETQDKVNKEKAAMVKFRQKEKNW